MDIYLGLRNFLLVFSQYSSYQPPGPHQRIRFFAGLCRWKPLRDVDGIPVEREWRRYIERSKEEWDNQTVPPRHQLGRAGLPAYWHSTGYLGRTLDNNESSLTGDHTLVTTNKPLHCVKGDFVVKYFTPKQSSPGWTVNL